MPDKKNRTPIPPAIAARVQFMHDRTCCVCRRRKPIQIHHMDDNPSNNDESNLAILCFDCHRDTQISGGFDRKLDHEQVKLYRDDWVRTVEIMRSSGGNERPEPAPPGVDTRILAVKIDAARDHEDWFTLGRIYHDIGESELRDKYFDKALSVGTEAWMELLIASIRGSVNELPEVKIDEALASVVEDWTAHAQMLKSLGRPKDAALKLLEGITDALSKEGYFVAAFYIKNALADLAGELFQLALAEDIANDDIWWQVRCYEELEWESEKNHLLLNREADIRAANYPPLTSKLAIAKGDVEEYVDVQRKIAESDISMFFEEENDAEDKPQE